MAKHAAISDIRTYVPDQRRDAEILDFIRGLEATGKSAPQARPALLAADGTRHEIPQAVFDVLRQVTEALKDGMGVTVAPMSAMLTTQEAADFLGIARPTLVRILERGEIPMHKPGRHRFVRLADLVDYQEGRRAATSEALDELARDAAANDLYDRTDGQPPSTR